jgi:transposase
MAEAGLFAELPDQLAAERVVVAGAVRLKEPERETIELRVMSLDSLIGADHPARLIWAYVSQLDLSELESTIKAREGVPGHPAITPRLLLALWLYATSEGMGSARHLERLCERDDVYRWLCGGVGVNHRTLGDFRVDHGELLNKLLVQSVTALADEGLIDLNILSQDGVRVRAAAGASSFRRRPRLEELLEETKAALAELQRQVDSDPAADEERRRKRRAQRAAERLVRMEAAIAKIAEIEAQQPKPKDSTAKASKATAEPPAVGPAPAAPDREPPRNPKDGKPEAANGAVKAGASQTMPQTVEPAPAVADGKPQNANDGKPQEPNDTVKASAPPNAGTQTVEPVAVVTDGKLQNANDSKPQAADDTAKPGAPQAVAAAAPATAAADGEPGETTKTGKHKPPRVSTTDPEARVIKMPDGGFRPAYNMQIASVAGDQIIVAVNVSASSSDRGLARPMLEQIDATYGQLPDKHLVDGGYTKNADIEWAHGTDVAMHCPPVVNKHKTDPLAPREDDEAGVAAWRKRMASDEGKATYRKRSIHECINARFRQWGLRQLPVRGLAKAAIVLTWYAVANNILQGHRLRQAAAAAAAA